MQQYFAIYLTIFLFNIGSNALAQDNHSGFLSKDEVADGIALLPAPPTDDSILFLYDKAQYEKHRVLRDKKRVAQAVLDARIYEPDVGIAKVFSMAFGYELNQKNTPEIVRLLYMVGWDTDSATSGTKKHYMTIRPFMYYHDKTCYPADEQALRENGGYPSGHTTYGWTVALVLAEINPTRQNQILKRGFDIGQSRVICGYHWQSDVEGGRLIASALVARLHANPEFIKQLDKAKQEFQIISQSAKIAINH